jgi:hypothetical protein
MDPITLGPGESLTVVLQDADGVTLYELAISSPMTAAGDTADTSAVTDDSTLPID